MAVGEAILAEDVKDVLSLMNPQFPGAPVTLKLNAKVLRDGSHVCDAEPCMQAMLCLTEEKIIIAASHTIIDMPSQQALDFIPAKGEDCAISFAPGETLTLKFLAQYFVELVSCLFDAIQQRIQFADECFTIWAGLFVPAGLPDVHVLLHLPMKKSPFDVKRVQLQSSLAQ